MCRFSHAEARPSEGSKIASHRLHLFLLHGGVRCRLVRVMANGETTTPPGQVARRAHTARPYSRTERNGPPLLVLLRLVELPVEVVPAQQFLPVGVDH